jgi:[ribosomal protein S18]-alanine N-acetyltransferase
MASLPDLAAALRYLTWRPMASGDLAYVAALEAQIHAVPWTLGNFRDALAAGYSAQVGEREGRIVVFGVMMLGPGEAQLLNLSVAPDMRRRGLGAALLARFVDDARRCGAEQMFLEVRAGNHAAIALYETAGFARIARRDAYYPATATLPAEDALVMRLVLGPVAGAAR